MPQTYSYPGVYIEEIPSGVRTIAGVSTSDTAFIDFFKRGPVNDAVRITSYGDFERVFGGLDSRSEASYAIRQYYLNGGSTAWVVRVVATGATPATLTLQTDGETPSNALALQAASAGSWGANLQVAVDHKTRDPENLFNLAVRLIEEVNGRDEVIASETFRDLSMTTGHPRYVGSVLAESSELITLTDSQPAGGALPAASGDDVIVKPQDDDFTDFTGGGDGATPPRFNGDPEGNTWRTSQGAAALTGSQSEKTGLYALDKIAPFVFNILCIPAAANLADSGKSVYTAATTYCEGERAFLLVDVPASIDTPTDVIDTWLSATGNDLRHRNSAVYFPRLNVSDPLNENRPRNVAASGTVAGIYARIDSSRGIWKAPAGTDASLRGASVAVNITDLENGDLNPLGVNTLRTFPIYGNISWGARTLDGADQIASEYKYVPVRRVALYIEESLFQGLKWVVFEPNDEPLWAQIRLNVNAFMNTLFRQGAFQGSSPREAYFVKCDSETTTQNDINRGIVNIVVGFAPLKPAEFVVIKLQQIAGQSQ